MNKKRKVIFIILISVAAACICAAVVVLVRLNMNQDTYDTARSLAATPVSSADSSELTPTSTPTPTTAASVTATPAPTATPTPTPTPTAASTSSTAKTEVNFDALEAKYPDLYAWIRIDGTVVDYPVMQSATDNSYYLNYTIDGVKGYPGSIFSENYNSKDFTDYMNVLYGHNLIENGEMFTVLHDYMDLNFMKEHQYIQILQPGKTLIYQVFTALMYDDRDIVTSFDFSTTEGRQEFLDSISSAREMDTPWRDDVSVSADDHLLACSTCIMEHPNNRRVVVARLTNPEVLDAGA